MEVGKDLGKNSKLQNRIKLHRINESHVLLRADNPKFVSSNITPATTGANEANPAKRPFIFGCELSGNLTY
jgi:hypothetical protein